MAVIIADETEKQFETTYGTFTLQRLTVLHQIEIHKMFSGIVGGVENINAMGELWALWKATIEVAARKNPTDAKAKADGLPAGFDWAKTYDIDFLPKLFGEFNQWVQSFRPTDESLGDKEGSGGGSGEPTVRPAPEEELGAA